MAFGSVQARNGRNIALPTVDEYKRFHGMLCSPAVASRCIDSFDGSILFGSSNFYQSGRSLSLIDYGQGARLFPLSVASYYFLVAYSLTGLCSILRKTKLCRHQEEALVLRVNDKAPLSSTSDKELLMPPHVVDYILERSQSAYDETVSERMMQLVQRFEFNFGGFLSVVMFHFVCSYGRRHLVEVYRFPPWFGIGRFVDRLAQATMELVNPRKND